MSKPENHPVSAIWSTSFGSADDKLVMMFLTNKHELGSKTSTSYKPIEEFLTDFQDRWCNLKDIIEGTRLSSAKLERTLQNLMKAGYVKTQNKTTLREKKTTSMGEDGVAKISTVNDTNNSITETQFCVTDKAFCDFLVSVGGQNTYSKSA